MSAADETEEPLFSGYRGRVLLSITGGSFFISMVAMVIPPLLPRIRAEFGISAAEAGLLMTVWWLAVALLNAPGGRIADELTHKTGLVAGLGIAFLGTLILSNANLYALLIVAIAIVGVGRGIYQPSAIAQISDLYVKRRAQALGFRGAAFNLGGVVSGVLVAGILTVTTWRIAFVPMIVGIGGVIVCMHVWNREPYEFARVQLNVRETLSRLGRSRELVSVIAALSLFAFAWTGTLTFLPSFLQFEKGLSSTWASVAFSGVFVVGTIVQPLYGTVGDRRGHAIAACVAAIATAGGLGGVLSAARPASLAIALLVLSFGLAAFWPVMMAFGLQRLSSRTLAGDWGAITAIFLSVEALGSLYVGFAIDLAGYTVAFGSLLGVLCVTIAVTVRLAAGANST